MQRAAMKSSTIRPESIDDLEPVRNVHRSAFGREAEALLVDRLREGGFARVSLVAEVEGRVVAHILFSDLPIVTAERIIVASALAPMAVMPQQQRRGIGSALVRAGLDACRAAGWQAVLVLGHRGFYPRFGFSAGLARQIEGPYSGDDFMAIELVPGVLRHIRGRVKYPRPFDEV